MFSLWKTWPILGLLLILPGCGSDSPTEGTGDPGGDPAVELPLAVGNRWVHQEVQTAGTGFGADTTTVWSTLIGMRSLEGLAYFTQVDSSSFGADTSYVRQQGNEVYTYVDLGSTSDPVFQAILDLLNATRPWKIAEFGAPVGQEWTIASIDTTLILEGSAWDLMFEIVGSSHGTGAVAVTAGTWSDAQRFRLHLALAAEIAGTGIGGSQTTDQELWFVDGVGIVKEASEDSFDSPQGNIRVTTNRELLSYQLR